MENCAFKITIKLSTDFLELYSFFAGELVPLAPGKKNADGPSASIAAICFLYMLLSLNACSQLSCLAIFEAGISFRILKCRTLQKFFWSMKTLCEFRKWTRKTKKKVINMCSSIPVSFCGNQLNNVNITPCFVSCCEHPSHPAWVLFLWHQIHAPFHTLWHWLSSSPKTLQVRSCCFAQMTTFSPLPKKRS